MRLAWRKPLTTHRWLQYSAVVLATMPIGTAAAAPVVEFDFSRTATFHDVAVSARPASNAHERLIEVVLPVSVRFRGLTSQDVDELDIEINGTTSGLRVTCFSPTTKPCNDLSRAIETTTTTKNGSSFDASLGGTLPIPA